MNKKPLYLPVILLIIILALVAGYLIYNPLDSTNKNNEQASLKPVVINEAVRTLLYLPLYHAKHQGFFESNGLDVSIVTGGTAANSFAAMLNGEADFSQADPMYVPISNQKGADTRVIAQVVARIAVWGLSMDGSVKLDDPEAVRGKTFSTHPRPMTAYTYTVSLLDSLGLNLDEVEIIQSRPPSELVPLLSGSADIAMTLEPNTSIAVSQGANVVFSYPNLLGDQIFTGLMTRQNLIEESPDVVQAVILSYNQALQDINQNSAKAIESAKQYFPNLEESILKLAIDRMVSEEVLPSTVLISEESWDKAIQVRVDVGDLNEHSPLLDNVPIEFITSSITD